MFDQKALPATLVTSIQATCAFSCLLGSFPSCLCRTTFMQSYLFPARFHHYRDTGWFFLNLSCSRLAYSDTAVTDFQIHNAPHRSINPAHHTVFLRAISRRPVRKNNYLLGTASLKYTLPKRYLDLNKRGARPRRLEHINPKALFIRILHELRITYIKLKPNYLSKGFEKHGL